MVIRKNLEGITELETLIEQAYLQQEQIRKMNDFLKITKEDIRDILIKMRINKYNTQLYSAIYSIVKESKVVDKDTLIKWVKAIGRADLIAKSMKIKKGYPRLTIKKRTGGENIF